MEGALLLQQVLLTSDSNHVTQYIGAASNLVCLGLFFPMVNESISICGQKSILVY